MPLESRVDYLTLHTGKKFQVPFDVLIVFATNLDPASLVDEAFLRRIPYKIPIEDPTVEQFTRIFELNCRARNLRFHQVMVAYLQRRHYGPHGVRCGPATRAISSNRSRRSAAIRGGSRSSRASCWTPPAARISSTSRRRPPGRWRSAKHRPPERLEIR